MRKYLSYKTLIFKNNIPFIKRGRLYPETVYQSAKTLHNLKLEFKTEEGDIVTFSDVPDDEMHIDKVLVDYEKYKAEKNDGQ